MKKRWLIILGIVVSLMVISSCTNQESQTDNDVNDETEITDPQDQDDASEAVRNPGTFIQATLSSVETLDLHFMTSAATTMLSYNVYDSLISSDVQGNLSPLLSLEVPSEENGLIDITESGETIITFPIRTDVTFHNGLALNPEDVKYSFMRGIISGSMSNLCQGLTEEGSFKSLIEKHGLEKAYQLLDNAITIDGQNIVFKMPRPFSPILDIIADNGASYGIMSKQWAIQQGAWPGTFDNVEAFIELTDQTNALHAKMMGTGPFMLDSWQQGERVVLKRFDDYWQGPAQLERVIRQVFADSSTIVQQLTIGDIDFANLDLPEIDRLDGLEGIQVVRDIPAAQLIKINFNFDIKGDKYLGNGQFGESGAPSDLFSDLDVRKGFSYAFDYDVFINEVLMGGGIKPFGPVLVGFPTANPNNPQYYFSLEKAEEHFRKAFDGQLWEEGFTLGVPYNEGNNARQRALEILQARLSEINPKFRLEISSLPWASYVQEINAQIMPLSIFGILPRYNHPHFALEYHMHSDGYYARIKSYSELAREKYDALIEELATTFDEKRVEELSHILQQYSYEDALAIFHHQVIGQVAMRDWVQGYEITRFPFLVDYYKISK